MKKYMYFLPSIGWMIFIFWMSHQTGSNSTEMSNGIVFTILEHIPIDIDLLSFIIRKCAHMFEYFLLYLLLFYGFYRSYNIKKYSLCYLLSILYDCSDEFHQLFIDGRTGLVQDVLIDTIGITIALVVVCYYFKRNKK